MTEKIDRNLPHYDVRLFLAEQKPGRHFDQRFAEFAALPCGPAYSTDLNTIVDVLNKFGWWWWLSHIEAVVIPTAPAPGMEGLVSNGAVYDKEGAPIKYRALFATDRPAHALCEAVIKAIYDLPDAFYVKASATQEAWSALVLTRQQMMAYYKAIEDHRQEAISRFYERRRTGTERENESQSERAQDAEPETPEK